MNSTMSRANRRNEIGNAVLSKNLTSDGQDWLRLALDPFHDYLAPVAGYPDADSSHTVVSCFQYAMDINKPSGSAGNWDCHVFSNPFVTDTLMNQYTGVIEDWSMTTVAGQPDLNLRPVTVIAADSGQQLFPTATAVWAPANPAYNGVSMTSDAAAGVSRVIGFAYEVVNTTAELYKQGAVTSYRLPQEACIAEVAKSNGTTGAATLSDIWRSPPSNVAEATLLGGTKQWAAADGVYVVVPLSNVSNPLKQAASRNTVMTKTGRWGASGTSSQYVLSEVYNPIPLDIGNTALALFSAPNKAIPFCSTGAIFTGLSNSTTLRLKVKIYVERAPTFQESSLSVLATPSAAFDAKALQLYSSILQRLPVAVPVSFNAAGDWWRMILDTISFAAPALGLLIPGAGPLVGTAVGAGAAAISKVVREEMEKSSAKKKRSNQQPPPLPPGPRPRVSTQGPRIPPRETPAPMGGMSRKRS